MKNSFTGNIQQQQQQRQSAIPFAFTHSPFAACHVSAISHFHFSSVNAKFVLHQHQQQPQQLIVLHYLPVCFNSMLQLFAV